MANNAGRARQPLAPAAQRKADQASYAGGREAAPAPTTSAPGNQALQGELRSLQHLAAAVNLAARAGNLALQRLVAQQPAGTAPTGDLAQRILAASGRGQPLPAELRAPIQRELGADLSDVRVHHDAESHELSRSVNAHAFTSGRDIFFQQGAFKPSDDAGRRTIAHELTHVVQQSQGQVAGTPAAGGVQISDPSDTHERAAEATADRAMNQSQEQPHAHS